MSHVAIVQKIERLEVDYIHNCPKLTSIKVTAQMVGKNYCSFCGGFFTLEEKALEEVQQ